MWIAHFKDPSTRLRNLPAVHKAFWATKRSRLGTSQRREGAGTGVQGRSFPDLLCRLSGSRIWPIEHYRSWFRGHGLCFVAKIAPTEESKCLRRCRPRTGFRVWVWGTIPGGDPNIGGGGRGYRHGDTAPYTGVLHSARALPRQVQAKLLNSSHVTCQPAAQEGYGEECPLSPAGGLYVDRQRFAGAPAAEARLRWLWLKAPRGFSDGMNTCSFFATVQF